MLNLYRHVGICKVRELIGPGRMSIWSHNTCLEVYGAYGQDNQFKLLCCRCERQKPNWGQLISQSNKHPNYPKNISFRSFSGSRNIESIKTASTPKQSKVTAGLVAFKININVCYNHIKCQQQQQLKKTKLYCSAKQQQRNCAGYLPVNSFSFKQKSCICILKTAFDLIMQHKINNIQVILQEKWFWVICLFFTVSL